MKRTHQVCQGMGGACVLLATYEGGFHLLFSSTPLQKHLSVYYPPENLSMTPSKTLAGSHATGGVVHRAHSSIA